MGPDWVLRQDDSPVRIRFTNAIQASCWTWDSHRMAYIGCIMGQSGLSSWIRAFGKPSQAEPLNNIHLSAYFFYPLPVIPTMYARTSIQAFLRITHSLSLLPTSHWTVRSFTNTANSTTHWRLSLDRTRRSLVTLNFVRAPRSVGTLVRVLSRQLHLRHNRIISWGNFAT